MICDKVPCYANVKEKLESELVGREVFEGIVTSICAILKLPIDGRRARVTC